MNVGGDPTYDEQLALDGNAEPPRTQSCRSSRPGWPGSRSRAWD